MNHYHPMALQLAAALLLFLPQTSDAGEATYHLWAGDQYLGQAPPLRHDPGLGPAEDVPVPVAPPPRMELMIVTTRELVEGSALLYEFIDFRRAEGWEVRLAVEEDWDVPVSSGPDDTPDRLRAFLAEEYLDDPGAFLLLIGDPDPSVGDLPMKMSHPLESVLHYYDDWLAAEFEEIPTDFYYADLDGDWDCDGDGRAAEYPDDDGAGCVNFDPELYVGRLPVYRGDAGALDELLARALDRDLEPDTRYRTGVLLPAALFGVAGTSYPTGGEYPGNQDGACIVDALYRELPPAFQEGATRLYEDAGLVTSVYDHEGPLERDEVVDRWNDGRGIVVWCGHGAPAGVYRTYWDNDDNGDGSAEDSECAYPPFLESNDAADLEAAPGAFTWHVSCDNGFPERMDNIGAALLYGGAIATATASRPAFGATVDWGETWEPRPDLASSATCGYFYALELAAGRTAGEALAYTKHALPGDGWTEEAYGVDFTGAAWTTRMEYNLYGDPTRSLGLCEGDEDCDDGSSCNGTESCIDGLCARDGDPIDCSHLDDGCNLGSCDPGSDTCVTAPRLDGTGCDDGLWCTESDECGDGICAGVERDCGDRDGYDVYCDEASESCISELQDDIVNQAGCTCRVVAGRPHTPYLLGWFTLLAFGYGRRAIARRKENG